MISVRSLFLRLIAGIEIVIFAGYLLWGAHGVRAIRALQEKNRILEEQIAQAEEEIKQTRAELDDWNTYPFYKEQYAREHLQMARKDDEVYLL